jgi:hypothetical protein
MSRKWALLVVVVAVALIGVSACANKAPMTPATTGQATAVANQDVKDNIVAATKATLAQPMQAHIERVADGKTVTGNLEWTPPNAVHLSTVDGSQDFMAAAGTQQVWVKDPSGNYIQADQAMVQGYLRFFQYALPAYGITQAGNVTLSNIQSLGTETIDGTATNVYQYTVTNTSSGSSEPEQVKLWVAQSTGLPVKSVHSAPSHTTTITYKYDPGVKVALPTA